MVRPLDNLTASAGARGHRSARGAVFRQHIFAEAGRRGLVYNPVTDRLINNNARNRRSILRQIEKQRETTLVLISCSRSKRASGELTPVRELYCSPTFKSSVDWAERRGLPWKVLSAKHGALEPGEEIGDYDMRLESLDEHARDVWADSVGTAIFNEWLAGVEGDGSATLVILAGDDYAAPVNAIVRAGNRWTRGNLNALSSKLQVTQPLKGMQLAERRRWLEEDEAMFGIVPSQPLSTREAREVLEGGGTVWFKDWTDNPEDYGGPDYPVEDPDDLHELHSYPPPYADGVPPLILSEPQENPEDWP